jgi:hypothetical protein
MLENIFTATALPTILATWQRNQFLLCQWQQNLPQQHLMWRINGGGRIALKLGPYFEHIYLTKRYSR